MPVALKATASEKEAKVCLISIFSLMESSHKIVAQVKEMLFHV